MIGARDSGELCRCGWARSEQAIRYHDEEWGVPQHDDRALFELLVLEGAQAGLSWDTILRRREGYRAAFDQFDIAAVADYDDSRIAELLQDTRIIRNRAKIRATIQNARAARAAQDACGSLGSYLWRFVDGTPRRNAWRAQDDVPAHTSLSDTMSNALKRDGFAFAGTTICYALMQAAGMVNDHLVTCFRWQTLDSGASDGAERASRG